MAQEGEVVNVEAVLDSDNGLWQIFRELFLTVFQCSLVGGQDHFWLDVLLDIVI